MNSLVDFLKFEGEHSDMFVNGRLPTLDVEIWYESERNQVVYSFFEKQMCPNTVLQKTTALPEASVRSSLTQEVVRRLKNTSELLPKTHIQATLSTFSQKLVNSGHSVKSAQFILVHGTTKYLELLKRSKLETSNSLYRPLHCDKEFDKFNRKLYKLLAKNSWYDSETVKAKTNWRQNLSKDWAGSKPVQHSVHGMRNTTSLQVPNSVNGQLLKSLAKAEPRIAKLTGYQVKMTEKSGKSLSKFFNKSFNVPKCPRICCAVFAVTEKKGPTL